MLIIYPYSVQNLGGGEKRERKEKEKHGKLEKRDEEGRMEKGKIEDGKELNRIGAN